MRMFQNILSSLLLSSLCSSRYILHTFFARIMGRTIPSFPIAGVLEKKKWKQYRKYLNNIKYRKTLHNMFSIANLYNSASYTAILIKIHQL